MRCSVAAHRVACLVLVLCLPAVIAYGQGEFGSLHGTISDRTDAVLPGVAVTLTNKSSGRAVTTSAGAYGDYAIRNLEPGPHSVVFELEGFSRSEFPDIEILSGQSLKLDAILRTGPVTTTIQVTDIAPVVDTLNSSVAFQLPQGQFAELPKARSFQHLAILAPGVQSGDIEGGLQIHGASGAENMFLIDGVATNSAIDGTSRQDAVFEHFGEVRIQTAGIEARYPGAQGGVVSVVTRSGGNAFHGQAWLYYTDDFLNAAPPRRLALDPVDNRTVSYQQDVEDEFRGVEPGFNLGGPILRDRAYFFTSWSPRRTRQDRLYRFDNGSESADIRRERTLMSGFNKISIEPGSRLRAHFSWLWTPAWSSGALPAYDGSCPNCLSSTEAANAINRERGYFNPQSGYMATADYSLGSNVVLSGRGTYFWDNYKDTGIPNIASVQYQTPAVAPLVPENLQGGVGFQNTPAILKHEHDRVARTSGLVEVSILGSALGFHNLRAGFGAEKIVNDVSAGYPGGYVYLWWDRAFTSPATGIQDRGTYGYYEVNDFRKQGSAGATTKSWYVQDNWRVHDRLTLNVGLRMEAERVPSFRPDIRSTAIDFGWTDRLSPRIGGAYDLLGDGRLKVFASWGRYFDPMRFDLARTVFGGETWRTYYRSLDTLDVFSLSLDNLPGRDLWNPGVSQYRDRRSAVAGIQSVAPDLKPMSQDQWSAGADYQWNSRTSIGVRYVHQRLRRAIEDLAVLVGGNAAYIYANPGEGIAVEAPFVTGLTEVPPAYPKPVRTYDGVEFTISRRSAGPWFGSLSYTWSRLYGNYAGPASSDELLTPVTGLSYATAQQSGGSIAHPARYANYGWDLDEILFDAGGNFDPRGRLATDRPHVLKAHGGYEFDFQRRGMTSLGAFFYFGSGTPLSTQVWTTNHVPVFVNGRGDLGRTATLSYTDLQVAHTIDVAELQTLRIELNVLNAFNQQTSRHRFTGLNRGTGVPVESSAIDLSNTDLRNGYDPNALIQATPDAANAFDPRYAMDDLFNEGASARFGLKWAF